MEKGEASTSASSSSPSVDNNHKHIDAAIVPEDDEPVPNYRGIRAMPFIMGNEIFEKLGTTGSSSNLVVYLTTVFNMKSVTVTTLLNVFNGTTNLTPLIGGFLSDAYFGRYTTLGFACIASFLGMMILMLTAAVPSLHPPTCIRLSRDTQCEGPSSSQLAFLLAGFVFLIVGAAGIRPCNLAFGADQFNPKTESGKRGISSFFNWYYFTYTCAVMISVTVIVWVQTDVSWALGLGIPAGLMLLAVVVFFLGTNIYVVVKPQGSLLTSVAQVLVAAFHKKAKQLPENPAFELYNYNQPKSKNSKLSHTNQFSWLDKAAIISEEDEFKEDGSPENAWRLCSIQQVEEVKCLVRIIPIWASAIIYNVPLVQQQTYTVYQAIQSDRSLGSTGFKIPPGTFIIFSMLALTLWVPIYDRLLVPRLQKLTKKEGGITVLQRMGIGLFLSIVCMFVSGVVEERRRHVALTEPTLGVSRTGGAISSMSSMLLVPQLAIAGFSEAFNYIAQVEFFYTQFPENMRSIAGSIFWASLGLANYINSLLVNVIHSVTDKNGKGDWLPNDLNQGKLDYYYYLIGGMGVINFIYFLFASWWFKYKAIAVSGRRPAENELSVRPDQSPKHLG